MKSPNEWRNRNVIKHTKCEPKHDEQRNKCRGKNSRMHNASFTSSSSFPFHSLLLLINFCDFFFFLLSCYLNGRLKWYILMLMVCDARVWLCLNGRIFVATKCQTHSMHIHTVRAWSRMWKSRESKKQANTKVWKENKALSVRFYEKFISMTQFICACTTFAYLLIVLDKCSLEMLSSSFQMAGHKATQRGRHRAKWLSLNCINPSTPRKKLFRSFAMMKLHFCIFNESYSLACVCAQCASTYAYPRIWNPIQFIHAQKCYCCYCIIFI